MKLLLFSLFLLSSSTVSATSVVEDEACEHWKNISEIKDFDRLGYSNDEVCLLYFLLAKEQRITHNFRSIYDHPPPEKTTIEVSDLKIEHVELAKGSTYQFNIYGFVDLSWKDSRLGWDNEQFHISSLTLTNPQQVVWTPNMFDKYKQLCTDKTTCDSTWFDVTAEADGNVSGRLHFRYAAFCSLDFTKYPEEENNCCIYFTISEKLAFAPMQDKSSKPRRPVVLKQSLAADEEVSQLTQEHSAWLIEETTYGVTNIGGVFPALKVCVRAAKKMSTIRIALRIPVTIATLLMLASPLFGDLRTQAFVKIITLCIQTFCFLYLCSIAPENGFAGQKPKIYRFYESVFMLTTCSMLISMCCMALSRAKRTVPPSHRLYLSAKLVNRAVCCIEPEDSARYQQYLEQHENQQPSSEVNYTQDWRHIYMAVNNLISGLFFTCFIFFVMLDFF